MAGLFDEPYKYVIDSSALFDLRRNYPLATFPGVWDKFNKMCNALEIISVREVYNEVKRGSDWLLEWADKFEKIFLKPSLEEQKILNDLQIKYPNFVDSNSDRPAADPFVIACAKHFKLKIIQHEKFNPNRQKIPFVARQQNLDCIMLTDLFEFEKWEFK